MPILHFTISRTDLEVMENSKIGVLIKKVDLCLSQWIYCRESKQLSRDLAERTVTSVTRNGNGLVSEIALVKMSSISKAICDSVSITMDDFSVFNKGLYTKIIRMAQRSYKRKGNRNNKNICQVKSTFYKREEDNQESYALNNLACYSSGEYVTQMC